MVRYIRNIWILFFALILFSCSNGSSNKCGLNQNLISLDGDTLILPQVISHKTLVLRYSVLDCKSCIDSLFSQLSNIEKFVGINNIIVFTYYNQIRHFVVSARLNQIHYDIYQIPDNDFFIPEDKLGMPYFFLIDKDLSVQDVFVIKDYFTQKKEITSYLEHVAYQFNTK